MYDGNRNRNNKMRENVQPEIEPRSPGYRSDALPLTH